MSGPLIVGLGGTPRTGSTTERALALALRHLEDAGARTRLFGGEFLERLPHFNPGPAGPSPEQAELAAAVREADGIILATPGYHGSLSGVVKNALDTLELTRNDAVLHMRIRCWGLGWSFDLRRGRRSRR